MSNLFPPNDFDKRFSKMNSDFDKHERFVKRGIGVFFGAWLIWAFICLAGAIGLVAVAIHFISKFW